MYDMALPPSKKTTATRECQQQLLPDEVIEDILMRLPARSVARCRCLSRAWAAVLSSRGFINRHLDLATNRAVPASCFQEHHLAGQRLTRSCRGLVLVQKYSTGVHYVCNPSTGQAASLPYGTPVKPHGGGARDGIVGYVRFGLGHDARADRHKVVRLYYPVDGLPAGCEVYDVGASSKGYWRPAESGAKPPCFAVDMFGLGSDTAAVFAQGRVHWLASSRRPTLTATLSENARPEPDSVMSFSLVDETFTSIPLPPRACGGGGGRSLGLTVLHGGRLGLVSFYRRRPRDIWTLAAPEDYAWRHPPGSGCRDPPQQLWSQLATVVGSGYCKYDHFTYEESLEPVGRPYEDVHLASTSYLQALSMALHRLPARTLGRLKSVCRSWRAVLESDRFATAHNEHHRRLAAAAAASSSLADRVIFTSCPPLEDEPAVPLRLCLDSASVMMMMPPLTERRVVVSKPCHGLAQVMSCCGERTHLFNPVTRVHRIFSMDDVDRSLDVSSGSGSRSSSIGLGYDQSRQEHVLVLLAAGTECKVWRLREDVVGGATTVPAPPITPRFLPSASTVPPVYMDGRIHWMCCSPRAILAFCVRARAFQVVPAPDPGPGTGTGTEFLVELSRLLCVVQSCPTTETITIWSTAAAAGGGWDDGAWSRKYVIQLGRWPEFSPKMVELVVPMAIDVTDGRILLDTGKSLGYYDPVRRTLETVYRMSPKRPLETVYYPDLEKPVKRFFAAALWEESLVRPYDRRYRLWC